MRFFLNTFFTSLTLSGTGSILVLHELIAYDWRKEPISDQDLMLLVVI